MITDFKKTRDTVLEEYERFIPIVEEYRVGREKVPFEKTLSSLEAQAQNLRDNRFLLMVAGEAKSGKSTFINAYLGEEVLPMDVKQCSSAIVEIRYGESFTLNATFADGRTDTVQGKEAIQQFLITHAALDDAYRGIPVPIINAELIIKKEGRPIHESEIRDLLDHIRDDNLYNDPPDIYEANVRKYLQEKAPMWQTIVTKIIIEYPFKDVDMRGIQIVDSPGVNAEGRVGDMTNEYIEKANAVMFLKPMVGNTLEQTSFKRFLKSKSADRNRAAIFLLLTRAANETAENITRITEEAAKQYTNIDKEHIIHLDSKVQLFRNRIATMTEEELAEYMKVQGEERKLDSFIEMPWYRARFDRSEYLRQLDDLSNFSVVDEALNRFAHNAQYIALSEFLSHMLSVLKIIATRTDEDISSYKMRAVNPAKLAAQLADKKSAIDAIIYKISATSQEICSRYCDESGLIHEYASTVMEGYKTDMTAISPDDSNSVEELQKATFRNIDKFTQFQKNLKKDVVAACDAELVTLADKSGISFDVVKPNFTPEMVEKIKAEQQSNANVEKYTEARCFHPSKPYSVFSQSKYYGLVKKEIQPKLDQIQADFIGHLDGFVRGIVSQYRAELVSNSEILQAEYDTILNEKLEAEELQKKISALEQFYKKVAPLQEELRKTKGGVDKYVRPL